MVRTKAKDQNPMQEAEMTLKRTMPMKDNRIGVLRPVLSPSGPPTVLPKRIPMKTTETMAPRCHASKAHSSATDRVTDPKSKSSAPSAAHTKPHRTIAMICGTPKPMASMTFVKFLGLTGSNFGPSLRPR